MAGPGNLPLPLSFMACLIQSHVSARSQITECHGNFRCLSGVVEAINSLWTPAIYYIFLIPELWRSEPYPSSSHPSVELIHLHIQLNTYYLNYPRALGKLTSLSDFYAIASIVYSNHKLNIFMERPAFRDMNYSKLTWKRILKHFFPFKKIWTDIKECPENRFPPMAVFQQTIASSWGQPVLPVSDESLQRECLPM